MINSANRLESWRRSNRRNRMAKTSVQIAKTLKK
jgi:hypothetical protein